MADETVRAIHVLVEQLQRLTAVLQADVDARQEQRKSSDEQSAHHRERMKLSDERLKKSEERTKEHDQRMEDLRRETRDWQQHQRNTWDQLLVELKRHNDLLTQLLKAKQ